MFLRINYSWIRMLLLQTNAAAAVAVGIGGDIQIVDYIL